MWTVIFLAQKQSIAAGVRDALEREGVLVRVRPCGGESGEGFEIMVPETEIEQAHNIIIDAGL